MDTLQYQSQLSETFQEVRALSFEVKNEAPYNDKGLNNFLDAIIDLKSSLTLRTDKAQFIIEKIEKISWFNNPDKGALMLLNDLIAALRDLHTSQMRYYRSLIQIRDKGIAKEEIKNFKGAIDDFKEVASDLESRFFFLPAMEEFESVTKELSLL